MSALMNLIQSTIRNSAITQLSEQLGKDEQTTSSAIDSALPILIGALYRSATKDEGAGLSQALESKHDGRILDDISAHVTNNDQADGRSILRHILGANLDAVAMILGAQAGIGERRATSLMAILAPLLLGVLGKAKAQSKLSAGHLTRLLCAEAEGLTKRSPTMMYAIAELLDTDSNNRNLSRRL